MIKVLYVEGCRDGTVGGSHTCLEAFVANVDRRKIDPLVVFYDEHFIAARMRSRSVETCVFPNPSQFDVRAALQGRTKTLRLLGQVLLPAQKLANFGWFFLRPALHCARFIREHSIDVVHLNNSLNGNHEWMLGAQLSGTPLISHERGIIPQLSRTARYFANRASYLVCVSRTIAAPLLAQGLSDRKVVVVYDGIDPSRTRVRRDALTVRSDFGIAPDDPVIGIVGNVKQWKGQETVVRATALLKDRLPNVRCLIVGGYDSGDDYKRRLDGVIQSAGLAQHVVFTGFQSNPADIINVMDVVVHASILPEPFGMVNVEAMSLGKAVISTNIGGPTEVVEDGVSGLLIEPGDPVLLAEKLEFLLANGPLRRQMGHKASAVVKGRFTIQRTVDQIQGLYETLCRRRTLGPSA